MSVEVRKIYRMLAKMAQSCAERDMQKVYISLQKMSKKCRFFWRVMYMVGWDVRPREDSITKKAPQYRELFSI